MDYFIKLKGLWEELNEHRPVFACSCIHQCRCLATQNVHAYRHEDQVMQFLVGLNDQFSVMKTQVLFIEPLPLIYKVYSLVVQEESNQIPGQVPQLAAYWRSLDAKCLLAVKIVYSKMVILMQLLCKKIELEIHWYQLGEIPWTGQWSEYNANIAIHRVIFSQQSLAFLSEVYL